MAKEERPATHFIERARSGRSTCASCGGTISDGELRFSEAVVSDEGKWARAHQTARIVRRTEGTGGGRSFGYDATNPEIRSRFHHLICAATHQPYNLRSALATCSLELPDRAELEAAIERGLSVVDAAEANEATRDDYHQFIERLRDEPDDDLQLVFGDWLQKAGDPRGELVATQHALETATGDERLALVDCERKLLASHRKQLVPERLEGTLTWRRGFIHRVALTNVDATTLGRALAHPSFRLVRVLAVAMSSSLAVAANLPRPLPPTLRTIALASDQTYYGYLGFVGPILENALPQLERLLLEGTCDLADLAHPTLSELDLTCDDATRPRNAVSAERRLSAVPIGRTLLDRLRELDREKLPKLRRLILRIKRGMDETVAVLAQNGIVAQLDMLGLHGDLTLAGLEPLRVAKVKLEVLDVRKTGIVAADAGALAALANQVTIEDPKSEATTPAPQPVGEWRVRHTRKPEWGIGRVIEETDNGLQVDFEHGGEKLVRNVELLEEVKE